MRTGWILFRMECKKYKKAVPSLLLESLLFALLLILFGYVATKAVYGEKAIGEIRIGVVSMEEDRLSHLLVDFAGSMDSMEGICRLERMSSREAMEALAGGSIYAAVFLPEGIVESILNGENLPVKAVFSNRYSKMETEVFRQLAEAGTGLLQTAQAGIYAADALCRAMGEEEKIEETESYLNQAYLDYALNRQAVFKLQEVNAAGKASLLQYYASAVLLLFLSFAGLILGRSARTGESALGGILRAKGCGSCQQYLSEHFAYTVIFSLFGLLTTFPFLQVARVAEGEKPLGAAEGLVVLLVLFSMGTCLRSLIELAGSTPGGIGLLFVLLLLGMFAGGLLIPAAFLPEAAVAAGKLLPYPVWHELLLFPGRGNGAAGEQLILLLGLIVAGTAAGVCFQRVRKAWL